MTSRPVSAPTPARRRLVEAARVLARLSRTVERACADAGLSLPQYRALLFVSNAPQRAGLVASKAAISRPALTDLVDGLERQGFLRRTPVEGDRRGVELELTGKGAEALARAEESLVERLTELVPDRGLLERMASVEPALDAALKKLLDTPQESSKA